MKQRTSAPTDTVLAKARMDKLRAKNDRTALGGVLAGLDNLVDYFCP
jgi:hypothetical protein